MWLLCKIEPFQVAICRAGYQPKEQHQHDNTEVTRSKRLRIAQTYQTLNNKQAPNVLTRTSRGGDHSGQCAGEIVVVSHFPPTKQGLLQRVQGPMSVAEVGSEAGHVASLKGAETARRYGFPELDHKVCRAAWGLCAYNGHNIGIALLRVPRH
jgi:hypothetical protein